MTYTHSSSVKVSSSLKFNEPLTTTTVGKLPTRLSSIKKRLIWLQKPIQSLSSTFFTPICLLRHGRLRNFQHRLVTHIQHTIFFAKVNASLTNYRRNHQPNLFDKKHFTLVLKCNVGYFPKSKPDFWSCANDERVS